MKKMVPDIYIQKKAVPPTAGLDTYIRLQAHRISMDHPEVIRYEIALERKNGLSGQMHSTLIRATCNGKAITAAGASPDVFLAVRDAFIMLRMELPSQTRPSASEAATGA